MDKARKPYPLKARERIRATQIIDKLGRHIEGECEMSATQINAARILLNKALPDLKAMEHSGEVKKKHSVDVQSVEQAATSVLDRLDALRS